MKEKKPAYTMLSYERNNLSICNLIYFNFAKMLFNLYILNRRNVPPVTIRFVLYAFHVYILHSGDLYSGLDIYGVCVLLLYILNFKYLNRYIYERIEAHRGNI